MSGEGKVVCVTGGSGFIASWIVKFLLQRGYTVRATVRDPSRCFFFIQLVSLYSIINASTFMSFWLKHVILKRLTTCLNLMVQRRGCNSSKQICWNKAELIDPAVKGTLNVLRSCAKSPSVKRVVLTSSIAAVSISTRPKNPGVIINETWFSDPDFCRESELWYMLSKTLAEAAAWEFVNENKIDMVVINPTMVAGSLLQPEVNKSVQPILDMINGIPFQNYAYGWVNVKDVADAHINAYEIASASGRYLLCERVLHCSELAKVLRDLYPTLQISDKCEDDEPYKPRYQISKEKAKSLGIKFIPLKVTLKETVESFREKKIVDF
ncbi:phenylacetaldehyde reductase isoform X2 [Lathyrus oleraceus]|uniref:phenylacetaldehyde reductase isoform X2 n=1 Tax=Pisum sativum TaxID=3888 RepID=UPI0021CEF1CF|nr:phenylacetaldehyde reductase-like isoform X2 [Pisum sativum]